MKSTNIPRPVLYPLWPLLIDFVCVLVVRQRGLNATAVVNRYLIELLIKAPRARGFRNKPFRTFARSYLRDRTTSVIWRWYHPWLFDRILPSISLSLSLSGSIEGDRDPAIMPATALDASIGLIELVSASGLVSRLSGVNRRGLPFYSGTQSVGWSTSRLADWHSRRR